MVRPPPWNKGLKNCYSKETLERFSEIARNRVMSEETRMRVSLANKGRKRSEEFKSRNRGKNAPGFIDGRKPLHRAIRHMSKYYDWRDSIFKRDAYTCVLCGDKKSRLSADHIKPFSLVLNDFLVKFNMFSPIEDKETLIRLADSHDEFWSLENGRTLCNGCHKKTPSYSRSCRMMQLISTQQRSV